MNELRAGELRAGELRAGELTAASQASELTGKRAQASELRAHGPELANWQRQASSELMVREAVWHMANELRVGG